MLHFTIAVTNIANWSRRTNGVSWSLLTSISYPSWTWTCKWACVFLWERQKCRALEGKLPWGWHPISEDLHPIWDASHPTPYVPVSTFVHALWKLTPCQNKPGLFTWVPGRQRDTYQFHHSEMFCLGSWGQGWPGEFLLFSGFLTNVNIWVKKCCFSICLGFSGSAKERSGPHNRERSWA